MYIFQISYKFYNNSFVYVLQSDFSFWIIVKCPRVAYLQAIRNIQCWKGAAFMELS
jgi:hypothetical protein